MHWIWSLVAALSARRIILRGPRGERSVFLTFDDGPHPEHTPALLDLLAAHNVKATFFLVGREAERHPSVVARLVSEGHVLGNHSMTHPDMRGLSGKEQRAQIDRTDAVLARFDGQPRHLFRPPRGHATVSTLARSMRGCQRMVLWSFDSFDYKLDDAALVSRLERHPPDPGDVLLFHDDTPATIAALRVVLPRWRTNGLEFAAL